MRKAAGVPCFYREEQPVKAWTLCGRREGMAVPPLLGWLLSRGHRPRGHVPSGRYTKVMLRWSDPHPRSATHSPASPQGSPLGPWGPCGLGFPSFVGSPGLRRGRDRMVASWEGMLSIPQFQCIWEKNAGRRRFKNGYFSS